MRAADTLAFAWGVARGARARTALVLLALAIGVASVVAVTTLGEGARRYVAERFGALGTNLLIVLPGRSETVGAMPGMLLGRTPRDLVLEDALALARSAAVRRVAPIVVGAGDARAAGRRREVPVLGATADFARVRNLALAQGRFLPEDDPRHARPVAVLGARAAAELFPGRPALGEWLRVGDRRFRVEGVLAPQGMGLGFDTDELVVVPLAAAQALFDTEALFRILVEAKSRETVPEAQREVEAILAERREGKREVTVITQDAVLAAFDRLFGTLTLALGGLAAISLSVAGVLVMNVMLVSVAQRRAEIGLLKALGATSGQVRAAFLTESVLLACGGSLLGLLAAEAGRALALQFYPAIPFAPPLWALVAAPATALATAVVFALLPALRAARLDPVAALSGR